MLSGKKGYLSGTEAVAVALLPADGAAKVCDIGLFPLVEFVEVNDCTLKRRMDPALKRGIDKRTVDDRPRYSGHIRYLIRTPSHRISSVLLLEHSNDDDVIGGIDPEPGAVHAAPVESARAVRAAVETCMRWIEHDANIHAIADTHERLKKMHRHACGQQVARHQLDRWRRQDLDAIERAATREHLREAHVVLRRGVKPCD